METKSKFSAKLFFMHLLSMVALYASVIAFLTVVYQIINRVVPDPLRADIYSIQYNKQALRTGLSFLIVMLPTYIWSISYLHNIYSKVRELANSGIRKFLVYMTMFFSAVTVLISLVFLVNKLLDGELTLSFGLKLMSVIFVAVSVFGYYLHENKLYGKD